jgi:hypothetical protein
MTSGPARNCLKRTSGDAINPLLAAAFNRSKWMNTVADGLLLPFLHFARWCVPIMNVGQLSPENHF